jgi:hypothetical protein
MNGGDGPMSPTGPAPGHQLRVHSGTAVRPIHLRVDPPHLRHELAIDLRPPTASAPPPGVEPTARHSEQRTAPAERQRTPRRYHTLI